MGRCFVTPLELLAQPATRVPLQFLDRKYNLFRQPDIKFALDRDGEAAGNWTPARRLLADLSFAKVSSYDGHAERRRNSWPFLSVHVI